MTDLACRGEPDACVQDATITHRLEQLVRTRPDDRAFSFLGDGGDVDTRTWGQLAAGARAVAAALSDLPATQEQPRALLLLPQDGTFLDALFGCFLAGACAVPAHVPIPSRLAQTLPRLRAIVAEARPHLVLTTKQILPAKDLVPELADTPCIAVDDLALADAPSLDVGRRDRRPCDPAVLVGLDGLAARHHGEPPESDGQRGADRGRIRAHLVRRGPGLVAVPARHGADRQRAAAGVHRCRMRDDDAAAVSEASAALAAGDHPLRRHHQRRTEFRVRDVCLRRETAG